jgi:hypothetical protein
LAPVAGGTAVGVAALLVDSWAVPNGPGSALLWFALAAFATAAAFVMDEPSAQVVDAVPVPRRTRTARRLLVGMVPVASWLGGTAAVARWGSGLSWSALAVTGGGLLVTTLAAATALRRSGQDAPGELVAACAGGVVVLAMAVGAVPRVGPLLESADPSSRSSVVWVALAVTGVALIFWGGADPLTRWGWPHRHRR